MIGWCDRTVRRERGRSNVYPSGWERELARERIADARAAAENRRLAKLAAGPRPTLRARAARTLFGAAVALEKEEAWRAVWEKLEAPKYPSEAEE